MADTFHTIKAYCRSFKTAFRFLLIGVTGILLIGFSLSSRAASLDDANPLKFRDAQSSNAVLSAPTGDNLLLPLKQDPANFTTIHFKVLRNFKGEAAILPHTTSPRTTLLATNPSPRYFMDFDPPAGPRQRIGPELLESPRTSAPLPALPKNPAETLVSQSQQSLVGMEETPATDVPAPVAEPTEETETATIQDSAPEELYNFDGTKEVLSSRRSVRTQNALAEYYNDRMRELSDLENKVNLLASQPVSNTAQHDGILKALHDSRETRSKFETFWFQQNFGKALDAYEASKETLMKALFTDLPADAVEGRAIWLDRGTIVKAGGPDALRQIIRRIAASGFNIIYFETINAGFPIYPSQLVAQNPQVKGWDPLAVAVEESHRNGVELHAWVWAFAVGNTRHNKIIGEPASYPGPMLSKPELAGEALRGTGGRLVQPEQYEYWLSPASFKARSFLTSIYSEIVQKYNVDGLQLDYIRYPFQKPGLPMGLEYEAAQRFMNETGLNLGAADEYTMKAWSAWKAFQVTTFVRDLSGTLKGLKPNLKLSAAVFPMARYGRMMMIQQDWETWVRNGWIDTLSPMAYSKSPRSLERLVSYIHSMGDNKTLVYPGLSLIKLNAIELLNVLEVCRQNGVMGTTLFAMAQFDNDKQLVLQKGPYKERHTLPPHRDPLGASRQMVGDTLQVVQGLMTRSLSPSTTLKDIEQSLTTIHTDIASLNGKKYTSDRSYLLSGLRDNAKLLEQQTDQWADSAEDAIVRYQGRVLKQLVDKVVRMVHFATYQIATPSTSPAPTSVSVGH